MPNSRLLIVDVAALSEGIVWDGPPFHAIESVFPAVTCTVQASFRTASFPARHGMIGNGLYHRELRKPLFWEQSAALVQGPRIWDEARAKGKRVAMLFWQQSLGESADIVLSPAPIHRHHGGMIEDCYCQPHGLYEGLCRRIGRRFKLRQYWGPLASAAVGDWIVEATAEVLTAPELAPDLCFTYLPSLDYDLQRAGPGSNPRAQAARTAVTQQLAALYAAAREAGYEVLVFSDYNIGATTEAVYPNRALLDAGFFAVRPVRDMLYADLFASRAFAMADHEVAHVYVADADVVPKVRAVLEACPGIDQILDRTAQAANGLDHANSGELVLIAEPGKWFAYPWWTTPRQAPDFASHVDIHRKPGYDPCELFFGWPPFSVSQNTARVRGSHGTAGPGRKVVWASTLPVTDTPTNLVNLAEEVQRWLNTR